MEGGVVAHSLDGKMRTDDIKLKELAPFSKMLLSDAVRKGLQKTGFVYPTAIQAMAIPMGKSGLDLLVQSKSGTGKTLIFCTIILEVYRMDLAEPQSLIVAPTREIAVQIELVLNQIGSFCHGFRAVSVIGGLDVADDRKRLQGAKAVVGTPGRLLHLIQNNVLNTSKMRLLILDEADKMYTHSFRQDLKRIQNALPSKRQTIACSATFCDGLDDELAKIMRNPLLISTEERATLLIGIKQFACEIAEQKTSILEMQSKLEALRIIFGRISFKQCLIFAGSQSRANSYCNYLEKEGWPCELISGAQDQKTRLEMFHKFREFKSRIIITTDLMSRGVDSEHVNLVINLELPTDMVTYLHRIGRAGRFGSHGIAINFVSSEKDRCTLTRLISRIGNGMSVLKFPLTECTPGEEERDFWDFSNFEKDKEHFGLFGCETLAPLASQDHSSFSDTQENKENLKVSQFNHSSSSIDTNTFRVDSKDSALNMQDCLLERAECNNQQCSPSHKLTVDSRQSSSQQLPSSNTIDDASSIAADSLRSSQQDISRYQSVLMQKAAIPTLFEFLVDPNSSESQGDADKKKPPIDLFEDYKKAVLTNSDNSMKETEVKSAEEKPLTSKIAAYKSMLIDQPVEKKVVEYKHDIYSDYANFSVEESSNSLSQETASNEVDKATFILSVATPSKMQDSIEEYVNTTTTASDIKNGESTTESVEVCEVKHFTSPAHNQPGSAIPDVIPNNQRHLGLPYLQQQQQQQQHQQQHNLTVNVGARIEIPPYHSPLANSPALNDSVLHSHNDEQSPTISTNASLNSVSNSERGLSSGFNERNTTSASSGIATSDNERVPNGYNVPNGYYTSSENVSDNNYEDDSDEECDDEDYDAYEDEEDCDERDEEDDEAIDNDDIDDVLKYGIEVALCRAKSAAANGVKHCDVNIMDATETANEKDNIDNSIPNEVNVLDGNNEKVIVGREVGAVPKIVRKQFQIEHGHEGIKASNFFESGTKAAEKVTIKGKPENTAAKIEQDINDMHGANFKQSSGAKKPGTKSSRSKLGGKSTQQEVNSSPYYYSDSNYEAAHALWMQIYRTQVKQIQDYVRMTRNSGRLEYEE